MNKFSTTLLFIIKDGKIMLAEKKRGHGEGKLNGVGGKLEKWETVIQAMIRETQEEIGVTPLDYTEVATIDCLLSYKGEESIESMYVFIAKDYIGEVSESEEMRPMWFDLNNIPYNRMWDGDVLWLKHVLAGKKIKANLTFNIDNSLKDYKIDIIGDSYGKNRWKLF